MLGINLKVWEIIMLAICSVTVVVIACFMHLPDREIDIKTEIEIKETLK